MGIGIQESNFLLYVHKFGDFKKTITIGRQNLSIPESLLKKLISTSVQYEQEIFVDRLLKDHFNSTVVDSIDKSNFEGATIIHDMNIPIPNDLKGKYDTVIDAGTLEHIYNVPQALDNVSSLCKPLGQIIHILPANNQCGHGFWQMSPELFFSLYSDNNGYKDTEVFLARPFDRKHNFYKVVKPEGGNRVNVYSKDELYLYVRTVRKRTEFSHKDVQQSDYIYLWNKQGVGNLENRPLLKNFIRRHHLILNFARKIYEPYNRLHNRSRNRLSRSNPNLIKVNISPPFK